MIKISSHRAKRLCLAVLTLALSFAWLTPASAGPRPEPARFSPAADNAYDLIAMVNSLRASYGLPPFEINGALMAAAQGHSDYQAATGSNTHTGPGGSTPKSRAIAAGYGGGKAVFVTENIAGGGRMDASAAVQIWQGDSLHLNTMLHPKARDVGAGVASNGTSSYYTLDVGYISGQENTASQPAQVSTSAPGVTALPGGGFVLKTNATATPLADGSIIHIVQVGEVLLYIAEAYKVKLSELMAMNGLNDKSVIYPGQKLKIKAPDPTPTATETVTPTNIPTATRRPTRTPTLTPTSPPMAVTASPTPPAASASEGASDPLVIAIASLLAIGLLMMLAGVTLKRRQKPPTAQNPTDEIDPSNESKR